MATLDASSTLPNPDAPSWLGRSNGDPAEPYECQQEIRLAVVMYGGVSLCIYINGVAQELLQLVRATAPKTRGDNTELRLSDEEIAGTTAEVYRWIGREKLKARFTIDVLSGTSAGGINAVFLAKALANDGSLDGIEQLWLDEGDVDVLVNDAASERGLPVTSRELPASLLNGRRMYIKLLEALDGMDAKAGAAGARGGSGKGSHPAAEACRSTLVDELDLFVTSTDLRGMPVPIALSDSVVFERRHKNVTQFTYLPAAPEGDRNDFCPDNNPFLAFAARCTSAFPFAFEPMCLTDVDEVLERSPIYGPRPYCRSHSELWRHFYQPYLEPIRCPEPRVRRAAGAWGSSRAQDEFVPTLPFSQRPFGDGGYLDNKPFSYAIDTLLKREAVLPVLRKLVYIEPSPEHPDQDPILERKPDALENSLSALTSIPRYESIREDLQRVMTQNEMRARVNRILEAVMEGDTRGASHGHAPESGDSYLRLRATTAVEEVAKVIAWVLDIDPSSLAFVGIRCLVRAYRNHEYATGATKEYAVRMFLDDFDVSFELRRLRFLLRKLAKLVHYDSSRRSEQSDDEHEILNKEVRATFAAVDLALPTPEEEVSFRPDLFALQAELFGAYSELRRLERRLASKAALVHHRSSDDGAEKLSAAIKSFANESDESGKRALQHVLATDPQRPPDPVLFEKQCLARAEKELEKPAVIAHLEEIADCYKAFIQKQREASARKVTEALHGGSIAAQLLFGMWQRYEDFDRVLFPILYDTDASEGDPIAIVRISPDEASGAGAKQRPVLKGEGFGHFGAFLERSWRRHDILWGRLHAAERIIQMLLPDPADQRLRDQLIGSAHERIRRAVEPELRSSLQLDLQRDERLWRLPGADRELLARVLIEGNGGSNSALLDAYLRSVPSEPDRRRLVELVGRSTIVIGQMIERIAERYHAEGDAPRKWLTRFGRLLIGLAEVASPRSPFEILYKYWLWLAYVFVLVLIGMGALLGKPELVNVALVALAITAFAHFVQWSTYLYFVPLLPWRRFRTVLSLVPVIGIVSLAILALYGLEVEPVVNLVRTGHGALGFLEGVIASHRQNGWSGLELDLLAFCVFAVALVAYAIWLHRRGGSIRAPRWSAAFPDAATSPLFALRFAQSPEEVEALCGPGRVIVPELRRQAQRELGFQALATAVLSTLAAALGLTNHLFVATSVAILALAACVASIFEYRQTLQLSSGDTRPLGSLARWAAAKWAFLCAAAAVAGWGLLDLGFSDLWSGLLPRLAGALLVASGTLGVFGTTRSRSGARRRLPWLLAAQTGLTAALVVLIGLFLFQPPREPSSRPDIETQIRALTGSER